TIAAAAAADAGSYTVVVTGTCGTVTSSAATLTVNPATAITTQPVSQSRTASQSVTFSVVATGANLSYRWRKGGDPISGATAFGSPMNRAARADAGDYDVIVSGACGSVTSSSATLTVTCPTIALSPATLPAGPVGLAYTTSITASGGNPNYTFAVTDGNLPSG